MTMYLPNRDIGPIGFEPAEFIDDPTVVRPPKPTPAAKPSSIY